MTNTSMINENLEKETRLSNIKSKKFIIKAVIISPIFCLLILIILQINRGGGNEISISDGIYFILIASLIYGTISIIIIYKILIPKARKTKDLEMRFVYYFIVLEIGTSIALFGLMIGILGWSMNGIILFYLVLPYIGVGGFHSYYLYVKYINPEFFKNHSIKNQTLKK